MHVAIMALTFRRPDGLHALLAGLSRQVFPRYQAQQSADRDRSEGGGAPQLTFVIVDNDPEGSGQATCESFESQLPGPLCYVVEKKRGISHGRNRALAEALATGADWLCFIDDDEIPEPNWLDELLHTQQAHDADVVAGPVIPLLPAGSPQWMIDGDFFQQKRHPTGTRIDYAYTNNTLFRAEIVEKLSLRFDERWALVGGGDLLFFRYVVLAGYHVVWGDDAVVSETIPPSRANLRWILKREFRYGNNRVLVERELSSRQGIQWRRLGLGLRWAIAGLVILPFTLLMGVQKRLAYLKQIYYGVGQIAGACRFRYQEYKQTHGQ